MPVIRHEHLNDVYAGQWNALANHNPFVSHAFLHDLQRTGCASPQRGWQATHLTLQHNGQLQAASPVWIRSDSHGEFVFDWHWADFYHRNGLPYYPKLLIGSPYSPVPGPRLMSPHDQAAQQLIQAQVELARELELSGIHWNFLQQPDLQRLDAALPELIPRLQWQFHWFNEGYENFDHFLSHLKRKRRKNIMQERKRLQNLRFARVRGDQADEKLWQFAWQMYLKTFLDKGNDPALKLDFFLHNARKLDYLLIIALDNDQPLACAIFLQGPDTLYGRYWGSIKHVPGLHFETCYYQAIEYCIEQGLHRFEPGAQGEHKMSRGFLPVPCWSRHWLANPTMAEIVKKHTQNETEMMLSYGQELAVHQPFKENPLHDSLAFR